MSVKSFLRRKVNRSVILAAATAGFAMTVLSALAASPDISAPAPQPAPATINAIVSASDFNGQDVPVYKTIEEALAAAPSNGTTPFVISIKNGRYFEKLVIDKPNITFTGESRDGTVITYDAYSGLKKADGKPWGTWGSGTVIVRAPDFTAQNLTIANGYDYLANDAKAKDDPSKTHAPQAVALMTDTGADRAKFVNIRLEGYQDTLFVNAGRAFFSHCVVEGNVDFIFGAGIAFLDTCDIVTRRRADPTMENVGYVTAPSTQISQPYGIVFDHCRLLKEEGVPAHSSPLGRPWHPTTTFEDGRYADPNAIGSTIYLNTYIGDHITEAGWDGMNGTGHEAGTKDWFPPEGARFFEYKSSGPGAQINEHRPQLSDSEASALTRQALFGDWQP